MVFRIRRSACTSTLVTLLVAGIFSPVSELRGDTVYLKNGAYIDGEVVSRNARGISVTIGRVGRVEIAHDDIARIEQNGRSGARAADPRAAANARREASSPVEKSDEKSDEQGSSGGGSTKSDADDASSSGRGVKAREKTTTKKSRDADAARAESDAGTEKSKITPELRKELENLVHDLQRQRSRVRHRAERRLLAIGAPAVEFVLPLTENESQFTRMSAFKILASTTPVGDDAPVIEAALKALDDDYVYAREYAADTLRRLAKKGFRYSPRGAANARRAAVAKWRDWWAEEKQRRAEVAKKNAAVDDEKSVSQTEG